MKRTILYILLFIATLLMPVQASDVAELRPVQVVAMSREGDRVRLTTDTGDSGEGKTALEALEDLKATTPADIYLDTAKYLLVSQSALQDTDALRSILKSRVRVCEFQGGELPEETAKFLNIHGNLPMLKQWQMGENLPKLRLKNQRLILSEKSEKTS